MQSIELNTHQIEFLKHVCQKRIGMLKKGALLILLLMSVSMFIGLGRQNKLFQALFYKNNVEAIFAGLLFVLMMFAICFVSFYMYYLKKIKPVLKDIKNQQGIKHNILVIRKTHFEIVDTNYLFFDDTRLPFKQVNALEYNTYNQGDLYPITIGMYSGIIMNDYMDFDL